MATLKGSQWNKWDLHVHTPASIIQHFGSGEAEETWEKYLTDLESLPPEFKVLGINDYLFIDGYVRLVKEKEKGRLKNIDLLLPLIEFRIEKFAGVDFGNLKRINLHVIFSNEVSVENINSQFLNTLHQSYTLDNGEAWNRAITKESIRELGERIIQGIPEDKRSGSESDLKVGFNNLNIKEHQIFEALKRDCFTGKYLIAIGKTEWAELKWTEGTIASKKNIINSSHIIFTAAQSVDAFDNSKRKLKEQNVKDLLLDCSDAHYLSDSPENERIGNCFTWIKADTTFEGLKQILFEPDHRLKIQTEKPDYKEDKLVIDQVKYISKNKKFTESSIFLNDNLNVIIGGKSSGKSILLYNIAKTLLADKEFFRKENIESKYDFRKEDADFNFEILTKGGFKQSMYRGDADNSIIPEIKYIPQNYLVKLAEPEENKTGHALNKIVRDLINEDRDSMIHYDDFISIVKSYDRKRESLIDNYFEIKEKIGHLEEQLKLKANKDVLEGNIRSNLLKVDELNKSIGLTEEQILAYNNLQNELELSSQRQLLAVKDNKKIIEFNDEVISVLTSLMRKKELFVNSLENEQLKELFQNGYTGLNSLVEDIRRADSEFKNSLSEDSNGSVSKIFKEIKDSIEETKRKLSPFLLGEEIKKQIEILTKSIGQDRDALQSIYQLNKEIVENKQALEQCKEKIFELYEETHQAYLTMIGLLKSRTVELEKDGLRIDGIAAFNFPKFRDSVYQFSDGRTASYKEYTICESNRDSLFSYALSGLLSELKAIFSSIVEANTYVIPSRINKRNAVKILLTDYFFDYWQIEFKGDKLGKMSTGKASFVILMLIVGLSKSKAPILIDQPEDNLDNRSITSDLVEYLRNKKLERQIILVTHNANVVVNADAENIIVANQRGQGDVDSTSPYQFDYINGPLENTYSVIKGEMDILRSMGIREHIAEIVEGGKIAFQKREEKYGFKLIPVPA